MAVSGYYPRKEMEHILAALTPENRLVLEVSMRTGLRISDVLNFRSDKLGKVMQIREMKTGKRRRITLPQNLLDRLVSVSGKVWVFEGRSDYLKHRTRQAVYKDLARAVRLFRLNKFYHVSPHSMRKIYAAELFSRTGDISRVQRALNHDSAAVTMLYAMSEELYLRKVGKNRA